MKSVRLRSRVVRCAEQLHHLAELARAAAAGPEPHHGARHLVDGVRELAPVLAQLRLHRDGPGRRK